MQQTIRIQSKGKTKVEGAQSEGLKDLYRRKNYSVVEAWRQGSDALDWMLYDEKHSLFGVCVVDGSRGIVKPNGLVLSFPNLRKEQGDKGMEYHYDVRRGKSNVKTKAYGGKVFQRCTQSLARDIMAEHAIRIDSKYPVFGLVHDEVVCLVRDEDVGDAKNYITEVMRTAPAWAPDLPLDCEVGAGRRYGEAK